MKPLNGAVIVAKPFARTALAASFALALSFSPAFAADFIVTKTSDSNDGICDSDCSLREAIIAANSSPGLDRVVLESGLTYVLTLGPPDIPDDVIPGSGDLDITDALTLEGHGSTIDGNQLDRVIDIRVASSFPFGARVPVTINDVSIVNGMTRSGIVSSGGGIFIGAHADVTLNRCTVANNRSIGHGVRGNGGGIAAVGTAFTSQNFDSAVLTVIDSTVANNIGADGGGLFVDVATVTITNSRINGNTAEGTEGGGIFMNGRHGSTWITNSELRGNIAPFRGGALSVSGGSTSVGVFHSRIVFNSAATAQAIYARNLLTYAPHNWWGCNYGPGVAGPGCPAPPNDVSGVTLFGPLVLGVTAAPAIIDTGQMSTVTADLTINSVGDDRAEFGVVPDGIPAVFTATLGTFATPTVLTTSGKAANVFTAGGTSGTAFVDVVVDGQTIRVPIAIGVATMTDLQADPPSPGGVPQTVTLNAAVASARGIPAGSVTFREGATVVPGCSAVSLNSSGAAACVLPANSQTVGTKSFTAEYLPSGPHFPSTSPPLPYSYVNCTNNPVVTTNSATGPGSVAAAVADACPHSTVTFDMSAVVSPLSGQQVRVDKHLTIAGPGADVLTVTSSFFQARRGASLTLRGMTLEQSGVHNQADLTISAVTMRNNGSFSFAGGAISNDAFSGDVTLTIVDSTLSENKGTDGAAIFNQSGFETKATVRIVNSTMSGNISSGRGAAVANRGPRTFVTVTNSTIASNSCGPTGPAGCGIFGDSGSVILRNALVAGNARSDGTPDDINGTVDPSSSFSLVGTSVGMTGISHGTNGNQVGTPAAPIDPRLGPLQNNGGPTFTHALLVGSPALDAGDNALASNAGLTRDQRGAARFSDSSDPDTIDTVDIGAFEATVGLPATITVGADSPSVSRIRRFNGSSGLSIAGPTADFVAFSSAFLGGVRVADADLTGDGSADIVAGTGPGITPRIVVFDGGSGAVLRDMTPGFAGTGGVFVAAGDIDGDGSPDIVVGDGGPSTEVRVFSGANGEPLWTGVSAGPAFSGGVRVASGDVDGDGYADVIVGSGPGVVASVRVLSGKTRAELLEFAPYAGYVGGVFVAAGDVNGDGFADVITAPDAGGGPHVRAFDGRTGAERLSFFATAETFRGGIRVAAGDVNGDGRVDVIAGLGPGGPGNTVQAFDGSSGVPVGSPIRVDSGSSSGLFVSSAVPTNRMVIEGPPMDATVSSAFIFSGWAFAASGSGTGIDAIHVWAYPAGGGSPLFLGAAAMARPRPDIAALFGPRYLNAGYQLDVPTLADGHYTLVALARSSATGIFHMHRAVRVRVVAPGADLRLEVEQPAAGAVRPALQISGYAFDVGAFSTGSGIEAVHVWAQAASGGAPIFLGAASLRIPRPDLAQRFGPRAAQSGYRLDVSGLAAGDYTLGIHAKAHGATSFTALKSVNVTVVPWAPTIRMALDTPLAGVQSSGSFMVAGWALALDGPSTPGIQAVHVYAYPVGGSGSPTFLGAATLGGNRPDVAAIFGPAYQFSGYGLIVEDLPSGTWDIATYPLADGMSTFGAAQVVRVSIP